MIPTTKLTKYGQGCFIIVPKLLNHLSPDMNPIENLWNELERHVRQKPVSSMTELKIDFWKNGMKLAVITHQKLFPTCHYVWIV